MNSRLTILLANVLFCGLVFAQSPSAVEQEVYARVVSLGELAPLPEAKPFLSDLANLLESQDFQMVIANSKTLQLQREGLKTSLYHLNLKFETIVENYPYDPPFTDPFPFRPTVEAVEEAIRFFATVRDTTGFSFGIESKLRKFPFLKVLNQVLSEAPIKKQGSITAIPDSEIIRFPVDSYNTMQARIEEFGETASFPEFAKSVNRVIRALNSTEMKQFAEADKALAKYRNEALLNLNNLRLAIGNTPPFPYRRTIQVLEQGLTVLDLKERIKYPEIEDWHEVEFSWYNGSHPKLRPPYHFNRYKYHLCSLLANSEIVILPFGQIDIEGLVRLRAAPFALLGATTQTTRVDRFHHTPLEEWYHDANHDRRMYGYDTRKWARLGITTKAQKIALFGQQEQFINAILQRTAPNTNDEFTNEIRRQQRVMIFETFHETALSADRESLLKDLIRTPNTPQPFERQEQAPIADIESIRTFDGNLKSGANVLPLNLESPTKVIYFYDRAPGFLSNIDNKLRWGFYDSVFNIDESFSRESSRTPEFLAMSALKMMELLGYRSALNQDQLAQQIRDRSGQPELYNYVGLSAPERLMVERIRAKTKPRIGIFIGSFDPPHKDHLKIVNGFVRNLNLDGIYVIPDLSTAYKPEMLPFEHRKKMVELTFGEVPQYLPIGKALQSSFGNGEMKNVMAAIKAQHPGAELYNIMGTDTLAWYQSLSVQERISDVNILVNLRDKNVIVPATVDNATVFAMDLHIEGISSTAIRSKIRQGLVPKEITPKTFEYMRAHNLYATKNTCEVLLTK